MPNCDFYAINEDIRSVLGFVFSQAGWTLYELTSRPDSALRRFPTTEAVLQAFDLEAQDVYLQLHSPEMRGKLRERRIVFEPNAVPGARFRFDSYGWGLIQLYFAHAISGKLEACHTNHNSERRACKWEPTYADEPDRVDDWDWRAVQRTSSRLNRFIRSAAISKLGSRPILPSAHAAVQQGRIRLVL